VPESERTALPWPTPAESPDAYLPLRRSALDAAEPAARCALTVDLEEWFHGLELPPRRWSGLEERAVDATHTLLSLLAEHRARATFFVLGRIAEAHPRLVERILADGHEVGSHGYDHQLVYRQRPEGFARDLEASLLALRRASAPEIVSYRAPSFSMVRRSLWALDLLAEAGITRDSSIVPARGSRYGIASAPLAPRLIRTASGRPLMELPISCLALGPARFPFGGGSYLRLLPLPLFRAAIRRTLGEGRPIVVTIRPWELDPDQPRLRLAARVAAAHYYGLGSTAGKLAALLQEFRWTTLDAVAADWQASGQWTVGSRR